MIKAALEGLGEFCLIFKEFMDKDATQKAIDILKSKPLSLNNNLYSKNQINEIKDFSIFSLGQILSVIFFPLILSLLLGRKSTQI
jgi:hypothetical protein